MGRSELNRLISNEKVREGQNVVSSCQATEKEQRCDPVTEKQQTQKILLNFTETTAEPVPAVQGGAC